MADPSGHMSHHPVNVLVRRVQKVDCVTTEVVGRRARVAGRGRRAWVEVEVAGRSEHTPSRRFSSVPAKSDFKCVLSSAQSVNSCLLRFVLIGKELVRYLFVLKV